MLFTVTERTLRIRGAAGGVRVENPDASNASANRRSEIGEFYLDAFTLRLTILARSACPSFE